jgi:homocitrate synthase NifV
LKHRGNYQGFDPNEVGREHHTVLGKHSGSQAIAAAYDLLGIVVSATEAAGVLERVRGHAMASTRAPTTDELKQFLHDQQSTTARQPRAASPTNRHAGGCPPGRPR